MCVLNTNLCGELDMQELNKQFEEMDDNGPKTTLVSRNVTVKKRRTSIRLEPEMWAALREISSRERCSIHDICTLVSVRKKDNTSLTAAIRVFIMLYFRAATTDEGHRRAGHGNFEYMKQRARIPAQMVSFFSRSNGMLVQQVESAAYMQ